MIAQLNAQSWHYFAQADAFFKSIPAGEVTLCRLKSQRDTPTYSTIVMNPKGVADSAIDLAAFIDNRTFYLFSGGELVEASERLKAAPEASGRPPTCDYQLRVTDEGLRIWR